MAIVVLVVAALSLFVPVTFTWIQTKWVNYLLMIVMFGMGLTLKFDDFKVVFTRPKDVIIGCLAQFIIMPLLAYALAKVFSLDAALMAGVVLVGTCPGGTSSNVITYMSKGDVALSVGMTSVNTLSWPPSSPPPSPTCCCAPLSRWMRWACSSPSCRWWSSPSYWASSSINSSATSPKNWFVSCRPSQLSPSA